MKVRPITVMAGLAALVAVAAVTVAWLPDDDTATVGQPASLPITLGARADAAMAPASTIDGVTTYVRGPGIADLSATQAAWSFGDAKASADDVGRLASALGVAGATRTEPEGWSVGPESGPTLNVSSAPGGNWTYAADSAVTSTGCAISPSSRPAASTGSGSSSSPASSVPAGGGTGSTTMTAPATTIPVAPYRECVVPDPPPGVPDEAAAEKDVRGMLAALGLNANQVEIATRSDGWSTTVTVTRVLDGTPTVGIDTVISFGEAGAVTYASGWLMAPTEADTYPLVGVDSAIARLNQGVDLMGPQAFGGIVPMIGVEQPAIAEDGVTTPSYLPPDAATHSTAGMYPTTVPPRPSAGSTPASPPSDVCASPPIEGSDLSTTTSMAPSTCLQPCPNAPAGADIACDPGVNTEPTPTTPPEPVTVTITSAAVVLIATPGQDGSTWLVPAYDLRSGDDGSRWYVLGVDESFIAPPAPATDRPADSPPDSAINQSTPGSSAACPPPDASRRGEYGCPFAGGDEPPPTTGTTQTVPTGG